MIINTNLNKVALQRALDCLNEQGVIAYPTESVWGLGCLPSSESALNRILNIKNRDWRKGLILVASDWEQLQNWILPLSSSQVKCVQEPQPRPTTWLLPCSTEISKNLRGSHQALAVRVSEHPLIAALCEQAGPIVSTSANVQGEPPAKTASEVRAQFNQQVDYILDGELGGYEQPSSIKTLDGNQVR